MFKVECPGCKAPYQVDERRVPSTGLKMRCPKCGTSFQVDPPDDIRRTGPSAVLGGPPEVPQKVSPPVPGAPGAPGAPARPPARAAAIGSRTIVAVAPAASPIPAPTPPAGPPADATPPTESPRRTP